jgi:hypothetical protein
MGQVRADILAHYVLKSSNLFYINLSVHMLVNLHAITSTRVLFRVDVTYQIKLKKNTRNFHVYIVTIFLW